MLSKGFFKIRKKFCKSSCSKMWENIFVTLFLVLTVSCETVKCKTIQYSSYSQVSNSGTNINSTSQADISDNGPVIYNSPNSNLPTSESTGIEAVESTGRGFSDQHNYRFAPPRRNQITGPMRMSVPYRSKPPMIVYPVYKPPPPSKVEFDKIIGKGQAMDRYFPGEAVATSKFKANSNGYSYKSPPAKPKPQNNPPPPPPALPPASSFPSPDDYRPPKDLYSFPPNINASYFPPSQIPGNSNPPISSYLPPAAGPINGFPQFLGPVSPDYLPPFMKNSGPPDNSANISPQGKDNTNMMETMNGNGENEMANGNDANVADTPPPPSSDDHDHGHDFDHYNYFDDHDHHHDHHDDSNDAGTTPAAPPPPDDNKGGTMMDMPMPNDMSMPMDGPPPDHDHSHHHPHPWNSFPSFYGGHGIDAYPEIIFDHDHHHHHIEHMTTTAAPEPPPEPRVKKYSYFYIGRKLWYIPLYFTVWFSFYIAFLILKSIARHKVDLPNHYQRRRSIRHDMNHKEVVERVNQLTEFVLSQIDEFKEKYS